nr:hypothetical protein L203_03991 [Cryptococcus depauperatus CBS 7841]
MMKAKIQNCTNEAFRQKFHMAYIAKAMPTKARGVPLELYIFRRLSSLASPASSNLTAEEPERWRKQDVREKVGDEWVCVVNETKSLLVAERLRERNAPVRSDWIPPGSDDELYQQVWLDFVKDVYHPKTWSTRTQTILLDRLDKRVKEYVIPVKTLPVVRMADPRQRVIGTRFRLDGCSWNRRQLSRSILWGLSTVLSYILRLLRQSTNYITSKAYTMSSARLTFPSLSS